ncbi:MAG: hypothetical protein D3917_06215 [Candidatus Electrothrix sp. AX5]|nr:hypothetical protein [Candidatus Electrothrix sp. AX5]
MKDLLDKLSSYNIFNYLFPGIIFVVLSEAVTSFSFVQQDIILGVFLYYFIGLVISRVGSLLIEPFFKRIKFVKFTAYSEFISASKTDEKLNLLSEVNNMYRTFCSLFFFLIFLKAYEFLAEKFQTLDRWGDEILIIGFFVLFCFSYRKQTQYVTKRIDTEMTNK